MLTLYFGYPVTWDKVVKVLGPLPNRKRIKAMVRIFYFVGGELLRAHSHLGILTCSKLRKAMLLLLFVGGKLFERTRNWAFLVMQSCAMPSFCCCQGR